MKTVVRCCEGNPTIRSAVEDLNGIIGLPALEAPGWLYKTVIQFQIMSIPIGRYIDARTKQEYTDYEYTSIAVIEIEERPNANP